MLRESPQARAQIRRGLDWETQAKTNPDVKIQVSPVTWDAKYVRLETSFPGSSTSVQFVKDVVIVGTPTET